MWVAFSLFAGVSNEDKTYDKGGSFYKTLERTFGHFAIFKNYIKR